MPDLKQRERREKAERIRRQLESTPANQIPPEIYRASCRQMCEIVPVDSVDFIFTDTPYPRDFLKVHRDLAELAIKVLKPGSSLLVMIGHCYLPEILKLMNVPGLKFNFIFNYNMSAEGPKRGVIARKVMQIYSKPMLQFVKGKNERPAIHTDTIAVPVYDKNHQDSHYWGQVQEGIDLIAQKFAFPGEVILDPFMGGGSTGIAAIRRGARFIGGDIDLESVITASERISSEWAKESRNKPGLLKRVQS